jgi:hypothetical protein
MSTMPDMIFMTGFIIQIVIFFIALYNILKGCKVYDIGWSIMLFCIHSLCYGIIFSLVILGSANQTEFYYAFIDVPGWIYLIYGFFFLGEIIMAVYYKLEEHNPFKRGEPNSR